MATHDYVINDQTTPAFRADLNSALAAIATNNGSATAPATTYAGMWWNDTANNYLKIRNAADSAWVIVGEFDVANGRFELITDSITAASSGGIDIHDNTGTKIIDLQVASQATAEAGVNNTQIMTPLRVKQASPLLAGMIFPYAGITEPSGYLFCYGQSLSTTTYASLFAAIAYTYGGSGSTFNVPDLRGRVIAGQDDMGGSSANRLTNQSGGLNGDTLGATGGSETHQLTEAELPSFTQRNPSATVTPAFGDSAPSAVAANSNTTVGSDTPHNNVQPTIILNYIIKT